MDDPTETAGPEPPAPGLEPGTARRPPGPFSLLFGARAEVSEPPPPARSPEATAAWLHAVSGSAPEAIARGAFELAARFLARGGRVLLVDAGPRLALHRRFGRESRWGVVECLTGTMPVLGLVQDTGRLGLYLLAYGTPARRIHWPQLGRLLEEAKPHFGRAIVAVESDAPEAIRGALEGWHLEGWWAGDSRSDRHRHGLTQRLGIHAGFLDVDAMPHATPEHLDARLWTLAAGMDREARDATLIETADPPANADTPREADEIAVTAVPAVAEDPSTILAASVREQSIVESHPQVRERLRFLLWARRLQGAGTR